MLEDFTGSQAFPPFSKFVHPKFRTRGHFFLKCLLTLFSHKPKSILQVWLKWLQKRVYVREEEHWVKHMWQTGRVLLGWEPLGDGTCRGRNCSSERGWVLNFHQLQAHCQHFVPFRSPQKRGYLGYSVGCKISVTLTLPFLSSLRSQACLSQHRALCDLAASRAASQGWWCQLRSSEDLTHSVQQPLTICSIPSFAKNFCI